MKTTRCSNCHTPAGLGDDRCRACGGELVETWGAPQSLPDAAPQAPQPGYGAGYGAQPHPPHAQAPPAGWQGAPQQPGAWGAPPAQGSVWGAPQHGAYPPQQHGAYPPQQHGAYPPSGYPMAPWQGGPPMPPQEAWPVPRGAVIALGVIGDLLITLILWAVWREKYPLAARTLVNTFAIKVGVVFGDTFLFLLLAAL